MGCSQGAQCIIRAEPNKTYKQLVAVVNTWFLLGANTGQMKHTLAWLRDGVERDFIQATQMWLEWHSLFMLVHCNESLRARSNIQFALTGTLNNAQYLGRYEYELRLNDSQVYVRSHCIQQNDGRKNATAIFHEKKNTNWCRKQK